MIKLLVIFCFTLVLSASDKKVYTVQLFSDNSIEAAKRLLNKVPLEFKDETHIYKVGGLFKGRYSKSDSYAKIKPFVSKIQKAGFRGAFIVTTTQDQMNKELIDESVKKVLTKVKPLSSPMEKKFIKDDKNRALKKTQANMAKPVSPPIIKNYMNTQNDRVSKNTQSYKTKLNKSDILKTAKMAYRKGDDAKAIIYYEKALINGFANEEAKNNLCYLYGRQGALSKAEAIINNEKYQSKLIYSYAYGAVESNQKSYYDDMLEYINLDNNGKLTMLTAYYFETNKDMQKAEYFYKKAYDKNPTSIYNLYAYARLLDIKKDSQALEVYRNVLKDIHTTHPLYKIVIQRVSELQK